jgi:hemolysin activation/secretion protein
VRTNVNLPNAFGDHPFRANILAERASQFGASLSFVDTYGLDARSWRLSLGLRAEGAGGTFDYGRGALDATLSHPLGGRLDGSLTASAGTSAGHVPVQRLWYLGGLETVRGQPPGASAGNAYWLGRAELAYGTRVARPTLFFDLGWAGDRHDWSRPGRPLSGAGVGASFLDGLMRLDIAKGITPRRGVRVDFYVTARP